MSPLSTGIFILSFKSISCFKKKLYFKNKSTSFFTNTDTEKIVLFTENSHDDNTIHKSLSGFT